MRIIGIDPDTKASGVAVYENRSLVFLETKPLYDLLKFIIDYAPDIVCISAGWLNKITNFQDQISNVKVRERISERIGANHEIGKQIQTFCISRGINYILVRPRGKKLNARQFSGYTNWRSATNQETRDAAMTIYSFLKKQ